MSRNKLGIGGSVDLDGDYEISIGYYTRRYFSQRPEHDNTVLLYEVCLPHQCDKWKITNRNYGPAVTGPEALARVDQFIGEVVAARDRLASLIANEAAIIEKG